MSTTQQSTIQPPLIPAKPIFRNPFSKTKSIRNPTPRKPTLHKRTVLTPSSSVDPRALQLALAQIAHEPDFDTPSPASASSASSNRFSFSSIFSRSSKSRSRPRSLWELEGEETGDVDEDEPPVDELLTIHHFNTEYGPVSHGCRWVRAEAEVEVEAEVGEERGVESEVSGRQSLRRRCVSWGMGVLRRVSAFSAACLRRVSASVGHDAGGVIDGGFVNVNASDDAESVSEDPLAFAKEWVVEVRMGETEMISPRSPRRVDVRFKRKSLREVVGCWIEKVMLKRGEKDVSF
ncbi:hypothetical protein ACEPPN_011441 [Leptodophora sp. 'Broadleaf-Isolate-01']